MTSEISVAVTGANGTLGRAIVAVLAAEGLSVTAITRAGTTRGDVQVDLLDVEGLRQVVTNANWVVHAAGKTGQSDDDTNEQLANSLGQACRHGPRVINLSSVAVYGDTPRRVIDEDTPCNPASTYGKSKLRAEQMITAHVPDTCHLRIANVYSDDFFVPIRTRARQRLIRANEVPNVVFADDVAGLVCHLVRRVEQADHPRIINVVRPDVGQMPYRRLVGPGGLAGRVLRFMPSAMPHLLRRLRGLPSLPNRVFVSSVIDRLDFVYAPLDSVAPASWHETVIRR